MVCYHPLDGFYSREVNKSGKRSLTFNRNASHSGVSVRVPCGRCIGCRLERSRQWAMRCMHEKRLHKDNCFVTLTYDNKHLPEAGTLVKRDLQLFMKRLRNARGSGVRFYACGEYGSLNRRPHYHLILFNVAFPDKVFSRNAKGGEKLYTSSELSTYWPFGFHLIGDVTFESAAYVARYIVEKLNGSLAPSRYDVVDGDGVVHSRLPEFTLMSRRPGIGSGWFDKYGKHAYEHDSVIMRGREVRPPKYYDSKYELGYPGDMEEIKRERKRIAALQYKENLIDRRLVREKVQELNLRQLKRDL